MLNLQNAYLEDWIVPVIDIGNSTLQHDLTNLPTVDFKSLAERATPAWLCGPRQPSTWNYKPVLGSTSIGTSTAPPYVQRFGSGGLGSAKASIGMSPISVHFSLLIVIIGILLLA